MRRLQLTFVTLVLALAAIGWAWNQTQTRIVIVHTGDIHGQILPRDGVGGMAELATLVRKSTPDLILDSGDMFTGTMLSDEFEGRPLIEIMNRIGYAAAALGNHEFDYGMGPLEARIAEAGFPILSANVEGVDGVLPYVVVPVRGVHIGIVGLTVETLRRVTHPKNLQTVTVAGVTDALAGVMPELGSRSDFVIVLAHVSREEQFDIARAFPEIPLIVAGHPHAARATQSGQTTIVEAGSSTRFLGRVEITLSGRRPESVTHELIPVEGVEGDPEIAALIRPYEETVRERAGELLGEALADLSNSRDGESALANLIADAFREEAGTDVALHNLGGIRAPLPRGAITYGAVFEVLPFQNTLVKLTLTGGQLKRLLGRSLQAVSGIRGEWDLDRPYPNRLVSAMFDDGAPVLDDARYSVAVNDFMWAGGDGLNELTSAVDVEDTGRLLRDVLADSIRRNPIVTGQADGRVVTRN